MSRPMTRAALEALGMNDRELERLTFKHFEVRLDLSGPDDEWTQTRRRMWFDNVSVRTQATIVDLDNEPIGAFGADDPKTHFGGP